MRAWIFILVVLTGCMTQENPIETQLQSRSLAPPLVHDPGEAYFEGRVIHGVSLKGLGGVEVQLSGTLLRTMTDESGRYRIPHRDGFHFVEVSAPDFEHSITKVGTDTRLWPESMSDEEAWTVLRRRGAGLDSDDLGDPDLRPEAREIIRTSREMAARHATPQAGGDSSTVFKQQLVPPDSIRIYRRGPENNSCQGRVDVIPFEDYVKGVVPHEWIASWADESLRAGSIAARSYAWGWINAGGKYDCADLDDSTRSQVYREDRTSRASAAVESTRGPAVVENGAVIRSVFGRKRQSHSIWS